MFHLCDVVPGCEQECCDGEWSVQQLQTLHVGANEIAGPGGCQGSLIKAGVHGAGVLDNF